LLRLSGSKKDIDELRELYNQGKAPTDLSRYDCHVITGLLKQFFRELPEPLVPRSLNESIAKILAQEQDANLLGMINPALVEQSIKMELITLIESLPTVNYNVLKALVKFFVSVEQHSGR
jgi:hypothetical protein